MKRLTIMRHAKSSWDEPEADDFDRPLNERGRKAARRVGREMKRRGMRFDFVLASTAARVRETLEGVREKFELDAEIRFDPRIYTADADTLLSLVRALPESVHAPLLVGHNPHLQRLLLELSHDDPPGRRRRIAAKLPTAAVAVVAAPAARWADIAAGSGEIAELILARELV
jgi:phosphohistidine phosphatase